jgi:hypothetical protein
MVFPNMEPAFIGRYQRFGGKSSAQFSRRKYKLRKTPARTQTASRGSNFKLLHAGFLLGLLFYPEDRGNMFL